MTDDKLELSRRKILAGIGAMGVAGAGAGMGTSAYFSDQETFANNQLTAGSLDLVVDWEEHYSDWSDDEDNDGQGGEIDVRMDEPETGDYRRFPVGATNATIGENGLYVARSDVPQFMDNTAIDALPDPEDDGTADFPREEGLNTCDILVDVGADDDGLSADARTNIEGVTEPGDPLINLQDVKPGDFGEVTFSAHLCGDPGNPGYLWMNMPGGLTASENGVNEPEAEDGDEDQVQGSGNPSLKDGESGEKTVELVDKIQTALWYDFDCDNLPDRDPQKIDLFALIDVSGSIGTAEMSDIETGADELAKRLPTDGTVEAGLATFSGPVEDPENPAFQGINLQAPLGSVDQFFSGTAESGTPNVGQFLPPEGDGSTPLASAIDLGRQYLNDAVRPNAEPVMLVITDGGPNYPNSDYDMTAEGTTYTTTPTGGTGDTTSQVSETDETETEATEAKNDGIRLLAAALGTGDPSFEDNTIPDLFTYLENRVASSPNDAFNADAGGNTITSIAIDIGNTIAALAGGVAGMNAEPFIFRGTLRELETELTDGVGVPLDSDPFTEERSCYNAGPGNVACFGFSWWLPLNHGNEVQTDSVNFDIGFYAEQCRHNDGSGMANAPDA